MATHSNPLGTGDTVLIVEDDVRMQKVLRRIFAQDSFRVISKTDGLAALESFRTTTPDAVVLDLMLPSISGRELCREMKQMTPMTPVIILSAVTDTTDKVNLLEIGADDYVTKPFSPRELLARVQAAVRRSRRTDSPKVTAFSFGECTLHFEKMTAERKGTPVVLTTLEFKLLRYLIENSERVVTRETLLNQVWGYQAYPTTRTVDNQILKLRQKLEDNPGEPRHLQTVYGAGYKFVP